MMNRAENIHYAKALLAQAKHFRQRGSNFFFVLLAWAGEARKRAAKQGQMELF